MSSIEHSIEVNRPIQDVYQKWSQFEDFPLFMEGIAQVIKTDGRHLHWKAKIAGNEQEWDAEVVHQVPNQRIAWRNTSGAENAGVVTFHRLDDAQTRVMLQMEYEPEGIVENIGDAIGLVSARVHGDLARFKNLMETGDPETSR